MQLAKKITTLIPLGLLAVFATGCAQNTMCVPGSQYNKSYDKCIVTANGELKAVVQTKDCNDKGCSAIILDERNRKIKVDIDQKINVGDEISIVLYKDKPEIKNK